MCALWIVWFLVFRFENIHKFSDSPLFVVSAAFICTYHSISLNISEHSSKDTSYTTQSHNTRRYWITLCQRNPKFNEMKQHERHNRTIYTTKYCSITLFQLHFNFPEFSTQTSVIGLPMSLSSQNAFRTFCCSFMRMANNRDLIVFQFAWSDRRYIYYYMTKETSKTKIE